MMNARPSFNTACELGFRGSLDEWESAIPCLDQSNSRVALSVPQRVAITLPFGSRISTLTVEV